MNYSVACGRVVHTLNCYLTHCNKDIKIRDVIEKAGCAFLYLPTYSPDLNPIKRCWAIFKII